MKKELYLDSALINEIDQIIDSSFISGVTTNPSLVAKAEKMDYSKLLNKIAIRLTTSGGADIKHFSVEVLSTNPDRMYDEAMKIYEDLRHGVDLFVKVPATYEYMPLITKLTNRGISVNATACFIASQAACAVNSGAKIVSFFYNRMLDAKISLKDEIADLTNMGCNASFKIICGSIRRPEDIRNCWDAGANIVTTPLNIIKLFSTHPKTNAAINSFSEDIKKWLE